MEEVETARIFCNLAVLKHILQTFHLSTIMIKAESQEADDGV